MLIASLLIVGYAGYALGRSDLRLRPALAAVTVLIAMILHGVWQLALPHESIEQIARVVARSRQSPTLAVVALVETAGIWIPVLIVRWVALRSRIWVAGYLMGAATLATLAFYESFDGPIFREAHPAHGIWFVLALVFAAVPFATGLIAKRKQQRAVAARLTTP